MKRILVAVVLVLIMGDMVGAGEWKIDKYELFHSLAKKMFIKQVSPATEIWTGFCMTLNKAADVKEWTPEFKKEIIRQLAKEGVICEVFGHRWENPYYEYSDTIGADTTSKWTWREYQTSEDGKNWKTYKDKFYERTKIIKSAGTYRKCEVCGKEQKYAPEKWEDWKEDR